MTLAYRLLLILVEGQDDVTFFSNLIAPKFLQQYDHVQLKQYSQDTQKKVNGILNDLEAMNESEGIQADYIFVTDLDFSPCVTQRKERIASTFRRVAAERILIVCREIESWYLAGLDENECERLGIPMVRYNTDHLTKEQFLSLMPQRYNSKAEFMLEILQMFDFETARSKNRSFQYFMRKYGSR